MPSIDRIDRMDAIYDALTEYQIDIIKAALRAYDPVADAERGERVDLLVLLTAAQERHARTYYADDIPE